MEPTGDTNLLGAVRASLPRSGRGGVAFVISDFFDPKGATHALSYLLARRYLVRAILVEDADVLAPPPEGRARLVDRETGETIKLDIRRFAGAATSGSCACARTSRSSRSCAPQSRAGG